MLLCIRFLEYMIADKEGMLNLICLLKPGAVDVLRSRVMPEVMSVAR